MCGVRCAVCGGRYELFYNNGYGSGDYWWLVIMLFWLVVVILVVISQNVVLAIVANAYEEVRNRN